MAASDEYPRGWFAVASGNGAALAITIPGVPNVSHVLDSASVKGALFSGGGAVGAAAAAVAVTSGTVGFSIMSLYIPPTGAAGQLAADADSWLGPYVFPMGQQLQVTLAALTGFTFLRINGHEI